jgi:isopenicillin-N epimerase
VKLNEPVSPIERWSLDPTVVHLNHGSYGGCLRTVTDAAAHLRARLAGAPMRFLVLEWKDELDRARAALAAFLRADPSRLVFVPSTTVGVALALNSVQLAAGDEIVTTSHTYRACKNQLVRLAEARGARIVIVPIAIPFDADALVAAITDAITPRTRLALLDHITSPTALRLPLERIVPVFAAREIPVIVDGAHAPGQIDLDVTAIGATWYVGNNHKWLCAPTGSGFLVAAPGATVTPLVTSHGASPEYGPPNRLHAELDWSGTHDPIPHLAVPAAIFAIAEEGGGWPAVFARNHALVLELRRRFSEALGRSQALAPDGAVGAMAAIPIDLPAGVTPHALQRQLLTDGWEVQIVDFPTGPLLRISAHLYNHAAQGDELARKLHALGVRSRAK